MLARLKKKAASLGDRPQSPAVYKLRRAEDIRAALRGKPYPK
jgi:hypothetical protein